MAISTKVMVATRHVISSLSGTATMVPSMDQLLVIYLCASATVKYLHGGSGQHARSLVVEVFPPYHAPFLLNRHSRPGPTTRVKLALRPMRCLTSRCAICKRVFVGLASITGMLLRPTGQMSGAHAVLPTSSNVLLGTRTHVESVLHKLRYLVTKLRAGVVIRLSISTARRRNALALLESLEMRMAFASPVEAKSSRSSLVTTKGFVRHVQPGRPVPLLITKTAPVTKDTTLMALNVRTRVIRHAAVALVQRPLNAGPAVRFQCSSTAL